jgi:hypothetical protein
VSDVGPASRTISGHGISVTLPAGWEGRIWRPPSDGVPGATRNPALHAASVALPQVRGDFGGGVVERLDPAGVFVSLLEYDREATATPLFAALGLPTDVSGARFQTSTLQRAVAGQSGAQWFFQVSGRAFCLYVVLGAHRDRWRLAAQAADVVQTVVVT